MPKEGVTVTAWNDNNDVVIAQSHLPSPCDLVTCERRIGREKCSQSLSGETGDSQFHQREEATAPNRNDKSLIGGIAEFMNGSALDVYEAVSGSDWYIQ